MLGSLLDKIAFSFKYGGIFKNTYFEEHLLMAASVSI